MVLNYPFTFCISVCRQYVFVFWITEIHLLRLMLVKRENLFFVAYYGGWVCTHILPIQMEWYHFIVIKIIKTQKISYFPFMQNLFRCSKNYRILTYHHTFHIYTFLHNGISCFFICILRVISSIGPDFQFRFQLNTQIPIK